jgi:hypothetical protein
MDDPGATPRPRFLCGVCEQPIQPATPVRYDTERKDLVHQGCLATPGAGGAARAELTTQGHRPAGSEKGKPAPSCRWCRRRGRSR